jgi:hypothetical protein
MGVDEDWLFDTEREQNTFNYHALLVQAGTTAAGPVLAGALVDGTLTQSYGWFNTPRGHYERLRTLSMLRWFLRMEGPRDLNLPITPVWAVPPIVAANLVESVLISRTRIGRRYLEHGGDRVSRQQSRLRFADATAKISGHPRGRVTAADLALSLPALPSTPATLGRGTRPRPGGTRDRIARACCDRARLPSGVVSLRGGADRLRGWSDRGAASDRRAGLLRHRNGGCRTRQLSRAATHLVVDLTHLRFCSGRGMAVLVETSWDAAAMGIGYSLAGCPATLARFMLMEWKDQVPHRYRNTADAIAEATVDLLLPTPRRPRSRPA